jgi:hypothetical protein
VTIYVGKHDTNATKLPYNKVLAHTTLYWHDQSEMLLLLQIQQSFHIQVRPVSNDSVFKVSVIRGLRQPKKKVKLQK